MKPKESNVSATKAVTELFNEEQLAAYVSESLKLIAQGKPEVDGKTNIAACHFYDTDHGRIGTFFMWMRGTEAHTYIGMEKEITDMKDDFQGLMKEHGVLAASPYEESVARRKRWKKAAQRAKSKK
jgi:hypothetical protein